MGRRRAVGERPVRRPAQTPGGESEPMMTCELILAAALLAPAQAGKPKDGDKHPTVLDNTVIVSVADAGLADNRPVDELIEVMRALLLRKLGAGTAGTGAIG